MAQRLENLAQIEPGFRPGYQPEAHAAGIVHLGLGAFHKAHQAEMTDRVLAASGGDWRIVGVSLRSGQASQELAPQNGLYTLLVKSAEKTDVRVIASLAGALCSVEDSGPALAAMVRPQTKIVSATVTEKAYGLDRARQGCDPTHPAVAADLANFAAPKGVLGLLVKALQGRWQAGEPPFTILCCDNLPQNGRLLRGAVVDFARYIDPALAEWIASTVAFPSTMVDRITPAPSEATRAEAASATGLKDLAAVETEAFCQWVVEDNFPLGRPQWELAGAHFTDDVTPFEQMKLRMLNGTHSMLAYAGYHAGHQLVREVMQDPHLAGLVRRHLAAAARTLPEIDGFDYADYAAALTERFENPAIAHALYQIAMDGSEKIPQRIFAAVPEARRLDEPIFPFAFATAAWLRHVSRATHDGPAYELRDPLAGELQQLPFSDGPHRLAAGLFELGLADRPLCQDQPFWEEVYRLLTDMLARPMQAVIAEAAQ